MYQPALPQWQPSWTITKPGTPRWADALTSPLPTRKTGGWQLLAAVGICVPLVPGLPLVAAGGAGVAIGVGLLVAPIATLAWINRRYRNDIVRFPGGSYRGVTIDTYGLGMLKDIKGRFDYAERLVDEVPTGIDWNEIKRDVDEILWDAVDQAAHVSACDAELRELHYAAEGSPQGALKRAIEARRAEHWQVLVDHQREADSLAREAGNAAAAAKVALARTGSVYALEVVMPSRGALAARASLAEARARLAMLADVWTELDETGALQAERLRSSGEPEGLNPPP